MRRGLVLEKKKEMDLPNWVLDLTLTSEAFIPIFCCS